MAILWKAEVPRRGMGGLRFSFSGSGVWLFVELAGGDSKAGSAAAAGVLLRLLTLRFERSFGERGRLVVTLELVKLSQLELAARRNGVGRDRRKR